MIIIGYQGIGKSTLAKKDKKYIDLESSNFKYEHDDGTSTRDDNWYKPYCHIAVDLHNKGYTVFTSSHLVVREYLYEYLTKKQLPTDEVFIICPDFLLKDEWIKKLKDRYESTGLEKDKFAYINGLNDFDTNIHDLFNSQFEVKPIDKIEYDLEEIING